MSMVRVRVERFRGAQDPEGPFDMGAVGQTRPAAVVFDTDGEEVELVDENEGVSCLAEIRISDEGKVTAILSGEWTRGGF